MVAAHRGGASLLPENSFPAFDHAVQLGVEILEFDMVLTADDHVILAHDPTVNGSFCTADPASGISPGPVREMTLQQVQQFDCGSHRRIYPTQKPVPGTRMPTLDAFLLRYKDAPVQFFGETKMPKAQEENVDPVHFARLIDQLVRKHGLEDRFMLQSSDYSTVDAMHHVNPRIRTCLVRPWQAKMDWLELARQHHATCMLLRVQDADAAEVRRLQAAGIMIFSGVADDRDSWQAYRQRGGDAIITNDPAGLIAFLRQDAAAAGGD